MTRRPLLHHTNEDREEGDERDDELEFFADQRAALFGERRPAMREERAAVGRLRRGARTMDAVKHLTRAGMGRCQGGFCAPFVLKQLANELGIPPTRVTKNGPGSHQILKMTKTAADN